MSCKLQTICKQCVYDVLSIVSKHIENHEVIILLTDGQNRVKTDSPLDEMSLTRHNSPHTVDCPLCSRARAEALLVITADLPFLQAARIWLDHSTSPSSPGARSAGRYIRENTETSYRQYCDSLALFFADFPIHQIHEGNLREYQRARLMGSEPFLRYRRPQDAKERRVGSLRLPAKGKTSCPVKPKKVNQELAVLRRILMEGCVWTPQLENVYKRMRLLEEESEQQRALERDEQDLWLRTAAEKAHWKVVHWYSLLGIGATLSTNELRYLRIGDVNLHHQTVAVADKGVKCRSRRRTIALLTAEELWAAEKLLERAKDCGATSPRHYLFPLWQRKGAMWEPDQPMSTSGIKREWQEVREASGLLWLRQYDLRHTGGTRLAEEGWRPAQIKARMGHITDQMNEHYTHITEAAQRLEHERVRTLKFEPRAVKPERWERRVVS